ncbi:MAG: PilN domain-containing protein [Rhodoferax sp.]
MIQLNLLPHRELSRKKKREQYVASVLIAALVGGGVSVLAASWFKSAISNQNAINLMLDAEILTLDKQIKDIKGLESQIGALQARQRTVEDVQSDRNQSVHLLGELSQQLPQGVLLSKVVQSDQQVMINGTAQSNEQVSELLRNLAAASAWFTKPELVESAATVLQLSNKEQRPMFNFSVRALLVRASPAGANPARPAASATGASGAASDAVRAP